jgi:predicted secreted protein
VIATTILATTLFGAYYWAVEIKGLGLDDLTFLPMPDSLR